MPKLIVFVFSGVTAGIAGALFASLQTYITPDTFVFELGLFFFICIIIGGRGTILGPFIGTVVLTALPEVVAPLAKLGNFFYGLLLLVVVLLIPEGLRPPADAGDDALKPQAAESKVVAPDPARLKAALGPRAGNGVMPEGGRRHQSTSAVSIALSRGVAGSQARRDSRPHRAERQRQDHTAQHDLRLLSR